MKFNNIEVQDSKISLGVLDDHYIILQGLEILTLINSRIQIVVSEVDEKSFYNKVLCEKPDILILDLILKEDNSINLIKQITENLPESKIIIYTGNSPEYLTNEALLYGAVCCIDKEIPSEDIVKVVLSVADDNPLPEFCKTRDTYSVQVEILTPREIEIVILSAKGMTYKEIAYKLNISYHTVDSHKRHIYEKLGAKNTADIIRYALKNCLI